LEDICHTIQDEKVKHIEVYINSVFDFKIIIIYSVQLSLLDKIFI